MYTISRRSRLRNIAAPLAGLLLLALAPGQARAQRRAADLADTVALGAFVDGIITAQMARLRIPSATVAIVQGNRVLYTAGYGHADLARGTPVDPATSLFHIGSTGKLFTWTAVMQLVEQGKLDLDRDVNDYLKAFRIPAAFGQPITLRHLMTHSAGFQEGILGYFIGNDSVNIRSIEATLREHVPARVRPPGVLASYSNYGASLAGLIVEQVSGEPFAEYIEQHIYRPLGIRYATFREPLPAELRPHAVFGYSWRDGAFQAMPFEIDGGFVPSGGTVASAAEMAKFMIAHLEDGRYGDSSLFSPATARLMHARAFGHDPRLPGLGLGFIEDRYRGHRIIGHSGDSQYFHVDLALVPDEQLGLFVGYGGEGSTMAREDFKAAFFDRYLAPIDSAMPTVTAEADSSERYLGHYRPIRMNYTDIDKLVYLVALPPITVAALDSGSILVSGGLAPEWVPTRFDPAGPDLFREFRGDRLLAFRGDNLFFEPTVAAERIPWSESPGFWYPLLAVSAIILLSGLIDAAYRGRRSPATDPAARRTARLGWIVAAWPFVTLFLAAVVIAGYGMSILERIPVPVYFVLGLPVAHVLLTAALIAGVVLAWRRVWWTPGRRIHLTLIALASIAICWFWWQWNVLGWQFG